ncbi:SDR family oxidoreductase [Azospirillum sp. RWY-5-1]|uniref:SDR family oxidoreductase n=1 Tax=Azospirillum oleiclasticum TaxID=2735135 RepID=A0ABX2TKI1_9PROT|nr:SDR family oxidoreductase [Azospirillum oleiclasticum]NYZ17097.1 SDR family oxidoreductase [Azospirillum oleiclasticum]NYZ24235.1 SDR family oxidoreductase [Azospirillum oleiclasticum]
MKDDRRVLIVTGGGRGIGAAVARLAARDGYAVCINYARDDDAAARLVGALRAGGADAIAVRGDVAEPDAVRDLFDRAERELGPVTALVNNAGITGGLGAFRNADLAMLRRVIDVNLLGTMLCAQEAVRRWERAGTAGRMVNVSSIAATLGAAGEYVHYAATKAAVESFTVGLAKELAAAGVRVNAVSPGTTRTDIHAAAGDPGRPARVAAVVPMRRVGEPDEIAEAVLWLLSDKASYVTGAVLRVAGGL